MIKMVEHLRRRGVLLLPRLPRIHRDPFGRILYGELTHVDTVRGGGEAEFGVSIVDGGKVAADYGERGVQAGVVLGHLVYIVYGDLGQRPVESRGENRVWGRGAHLEHAEVEKGEGREGACREAVKVSVGDPVAW